MSDDIQRKIEDNAEAISSLTDTLINMQAVQKVHGQQISDCLECVRAISELRDRNAQDIAALNADNRVLNEDIRTLLTEIREEFSAHDTKHS